MPGETPTATEEEPKDVAVAVDRLPVKRKAAVPLLPSLTEDSGSWNVLDDKMKHAKEMMSSTISLKPAKLARYDQQVEMISGSPEKSNKGEMISGGASGGGGGLMRSNSISDVGTIGMSLSAYDVIPLDKLRMEERHTPLDVKAFLSRVGTFDLRMWSGKPNRLCAFQCARYGWRVAARNTLLCVSCRNMLSIPHDNGCSKLDEWTSNIEQQVHKTGHMSDCIWIRSPSPMNILLLPEGNDMQNYMRHAAQSFSRMRSLPVLTARYRLIMDILEMYGFKQKTGLQLTQNIDGTTTELIEQCALFLMLNGWTMDDMDVNALQCHLCLRQVPLWLCLMTPSVSSENQNVNRKSSSNLVRKPYSNVKELDPITSHWFWCPWRKMLQRSDPDEHLYNFLQVESTNLFDVENYEHDSIVPSLDAYMTLAVKIDADFRRGQLVRGRQSLEMADNTVAISTIKTFKELLNALQSGSNSNSPSSPALADSVVPSDMMNEMVSLKLSKAKLLRKKLFHETAPTPATTIVQPMEPVIPVPPIDADNENQGNVDQEEVQQEDLDAGCSNIIIGEPGSSSKDLTLQHETEEADKNHQEESTSVLKSVQEEMVESVELPPVASLPISNVVEELKYNNMNDKEINKPEQEDEEAAAAAVVVEANNDYDDKDYEVYPEESAANYSENKEETSSRPDADDPNPIRNEPEAEEIYQQGKDILMSVQEQEEENPELPLPVASITSAEQSPVDSNTIKDMNDQEIEAEKKDEGNQQEAEPNYRVEQEAEDVELPAITAVQSLLAVEPQEENVEESVAELPDDDEAPVEDYDDDDDDEEENDMYPDDDDEEREGSVERGESLNSSSSNHSDSDDDIVCLD